MVVRPKTRRVPFARPVVIAIIAVVVVLTMSTMWAFAAVLPVLRRVPDVGVNVTHPVLEVLQFYVVCKDASAVRSNNPFIVRFHYDYPLPLYPVRGQSLVSTETGDACPATFPRKKRCHPGF
jgi:hypothetical protein